MHVLTYTIIDCAFRSAAFFGQIAYATAALVDHIPIPFLHAALIVTLAMLNDFIGAPFYVFVTLNI
jgi:hypothetical protein